MAKTIVKENKVPEVKKVKIKDLSGKQVFAGQNGNYHVRVLEDKDNTLMVYIKRGQKILVRLLPAMPKNPGTKTPVTPPKVLSSSDL